MSKPPPEALDLAVEIARTGKLLEAAELRAEAEAHTLDTKRISQAQEEAVEAFRTNLDARIMLTMLAVRSMRR